MSDQNEGPPSNEPAIERRDGGSADLPPPAAATPVIPPPVAPPVAMLGLPPAGGQPGPAPAPVAAAPSALPAFLQKLMAEIKATFDFYLSNRKALGMGLADRLSLLPRSMTAGRDIRLAADEHNDAVEKTANGWSIRLPDCCVVCGNPTDRDWTQEVKQVQDLSWPMYGPIVGLFAGLALNVYFWNRWFLPTTLIAGFIAGYRGRRQLEVRLQVRRCADHADRLNVPGVRVVGSELAVRVGNRRVKQKFMNPEPAAWEVATPAAPAPAADDPNPFGTGAPSLEPEKFEPGQMMKLDDGPITGTVHSFQQMPGETGLIISSPVESSEPPVETLPRDTLPVEMLPGSAPPRPPETPPSNGQGSHTLT